MRFFFDRNMSPRLARMIDIYERDSSVIHHDDDGRFAPTTTDVEWIRALAADDPPWVVLSGDGRILKNRVELAALNEARLTFFCMSKAWSHMGLHEYTWKFVKLWPSVVELAKSPSRKIFEVAGAKIDLIRTYK
jgi:PIN like domain